jgi:hypothetical protein
LRGQKRKGLEDQVLVFVADGWRRNERVIRGRVEAPVAEHFSRPSSLRSSL